MYSPNKIQLIVFSLKTNQIKFYLKSQQCHFTSFKFDLLILGYYLEIQLILHDTYN